MEKQRTRAHTADKPTNGPRGPSRRPRGTRRILGARRGTVTP